MKLPEFSVNRPVFTIMIFAGILLLGIVSLILLPIDLMPKIEMPTMSVITTYPGASAEDVETKVTKIIESSVSTAPNIKEVSSTSMENISAVTLRFEWGTNLDEVSNDVRQMLDFSARGLPDDAERPMLVKFDFSMMPIIVFGITAKESYNDLYKIVDENFCDPLKRVPGVASTMIMGGLIREIQVNIDRQRLEAHHLPIGQVTGILAAENFSLPAGDIKIGRTDYIVRVPGEFKTVDEIDNVIVGSSKMGTPIYLKDVASIEDTYKEKERFTRVNRGTGLIVMVQKQSGANTVTVADDIRKALPDIEKSLPSDVKVLLAMDTSDFIKRSITNLASTVGWALLFVLLIVFLFLREIRGSVIIALTIPFSLIVAFIFLFAGDFTINIMTLSAIAISIGMVVDNAIVIFENTYRHRAEEGESRRESAIFGSSEVGTAITASTLTTIAIFLPVIFVKGMVGIMFKELALVVIIVLAASLFCSLTFTPMLASRMLRLPSEVKIRSGWLKRFHDFSEKWFTGLENAYKAVLDWVLSHRKITVTIGAVIFAVSLLLFKVVGTEFMPEMDRSQFSGNLTMPIGTRVEVTDQVLNKIEDIIEKEVPERKLMFASCGKSESGMGAIMGRISDTHTMMVGGRLVPKNERDRTDQEISQAVKREVAKIPGIKTVDFTQQDQMAMMSGGAKPISIEIYGQNIAQTDSFALEVKKMLEKIEGLVDVTISREEGKPELWIEVDRQKAAALGLNMYDIANTVRTKFYGKIATKYREAGDEYDTFVRLKGDDRQSLADLKNAFVMSPMGKQIPIRNIAKIVEHSGPLTIQRKNQERMLTVGGGLYKRTLGKVITDIEKSFKKMAIPEGMAIKIAGTAQDQAE